MTLAGQFSADKDIESKTAGSVVNPTNGHCLKDIVKANGDASTGLYLNGLLINELILMTDGSFLFLKQGKELARIDDEGFKYTASLYGKSHGSVRFTFIRTILSMNWTILIMALSVELLWLSAWWVQIPGLYRL